MAFHSVKITGEAEVDRRWREWQARGAAMDRRTTMRTRIVMLTGAIALIVWFVLQLS